MKSIVVSQMPSGVVPPVAKSRHWRRLWVVALAVIPSLALSGQSIPAHADPTTGVETVGVQMGWDQGVYSISSTVSTAQGDAAPTSQQFQMDPSAQDKLPVRVRLAYQAGDQSGTDLRALKGFTGRVTIRMTVENKTVTGAMFPFESQGSKYRRYGLVGAPYTVVASASLTSGTIDQVVSSGTTGSVTDGVVSNGDAGSAQVLWTAILAPPVLPPSSVFTLVMDAKDFQPPQFDVVVEPGIVTDPSLGAVISGRQGANSTSAQLVVEVQQKISEANDLVAKVKQALSEDASTIGTRTFVDLSASAQGTLGEMEALTSTLKSLNSQVSSSLSSAESTLDSTLAEMFAGISQDVLGDPSVPAKIVDTAIAGCNVTLPTLSDDQPKTVSAVLQLLVQQSNAVAAAFGEQTSDPSGSPVTPNCRTALVNLIKTDIGDPSVGCSAAEGQPDSVVCDIQAIKTGIDGQQNLVSTSRDSVTSTLGGVDGQALLDLAALVKTDLDDLATRLGVPSINAAIQALNDLVSLASQLDARLTAAENNLNSIAATANKHPDPGTDPTVSDPVAQQLIALSQTPTLVAVCPLSGTNVQLDDLTALAADPSCPPEIQAMASDLLTSTQAAKENQMDWNTVAAAADTSKLPDVSLDIVTLEQEANAAIAGLLTLKNGQGGKTSFASFYSGNFTLATSPADACTASGGTSGPTATTLALDAVFMSINEWVCNHETLTTDVSSLNSATDTAFTAAGVAVDAATAAAANASNQAQGQIATVTSQLATTLTQQTQQSSTDLASMLSSLSAAMAQAQTTAVNSFSTQVTSLVSLLNDQVKTAVTESDAARTALQQNFQNLLIDLGDPTSGAPTGLLGQLKLTSQIAGDADTQLAALAAMVQADVDSQSLAAQAAALQSTQLSAGQKILDKMPYFCGQPKPDGAITIYTYHIGEG